MTELEGMPADILADPRFWETIARTAAGRDLDEPDVQDQAWQALVRGPLAMGDAPFDEQWALYRAVFDGRPATAPPPQAWLPDIPRLSNANAKELFDAIVDDTDVRDWQALHAWSVAERSRFWELAVGFLGIRFDNPYVHVLDTSHGVEDPVWFPGAQMNIVESCFQADPDAPAIIEAGEEPSKSTTITYGALQNQVDEVAAGLRASGFAEGDAIALYMPMNSTCVIAYLGIIKAGCTAISIADSFSPNEVATRLELGKAKGIVTMDSYERAGKTIELFDKVLAASQRITDIAPPRAILIGQTPKNQRESDIAWLDLLAAGRKHIETYGSVNSIGDPYRVTNILFSSGTTGDPKAIPWTHLTPIKCGMDGRYHQDIHQGDVVAWPTNIGWMMGPWLIYAALLNKATIALYEGAPHSEGFCRFVQDAKVSMLGVVPALVKAWRSKGLTKNVDWSGVRVFSSTGEASNAQDYLWLQAQARHKAPVIEYCGGTEIGGGHITGTVMRPNSPATFSTPALGLDFRVLDDEGKAIDEGGHGTLFLVPPSVGLSQTLLNRDHHEEYYEGVPHGHNGERLRRHGDAVAVLPGGFWEAQGRADDTMNLGGIKVSSLELERVCDADAQVYQSAAVAVQPKGGGADRLVMFVVPTPGTEPDKDALKAALQALISAELNPLFRIVNVVLTDSLPRTASNKIMRRQLRANYTSG